MPCTPLPLNSAAFAGASSWVNRACSDLFGSYGEPVMRTVADYRQLNEALFHAGTNSGREYEWEDAANRLHFYVVDARKTKEVFSPIR